MTPTDPAFVVSSIQNGPDAVALFDGAPGTGALIDIIVYEDAFPSADLLDTDGTTVLTTIPTALNMSIGTDAAGPAEPDTMSLQRITNACDRMSPPRDWTFATATPGAPN